MVSAIKNLEVQVGQLAERSTWSFVANTEENSKEECKRFSLEAKRERMLREKRKLREYWRI